MDAGLLNAQVTQTITKQQGDYVGVVKGNQAEIQTLLDAWVAEAVLSSQAGPAAPLVVPEAEIAPPRLSKRQMGAADAPRRELRARRQADAITIEKSRAQLEIRELWVVEAGDLGVYLANDWGWQTVVQTGWLRRWRKKHPQEKWSVKEMTVVTSRPSASTPPRRFLTLVRHHSSSENRVHWVQDVSFNEDRLHGRQIGAALAWLRNVVLNLMRRHRPGRFVPDVWSELAITSAMPLR